MRDVGSIYVKRLMRGFARALIHTTIFTIVLVTTVCVLIVIQGERNEDRPAGAAIVLGAAQWNGAPSPVLRARLDHAIELYRRGSVPRLILTGGKIPGDRTTEAAAGREYLIKMGVAPGAILIEDQSASTLESLRNAVVIARANGIDTVLLVSDPFHMLRSLKITHDLGMNAFGSPTRTSPIAGNRVEESRYVIREAWAYLAYLFAHG